MKKSRMAEEEGQKSDFVKELSIFYQKFVGATSDSIRKLSEIQKRFPKEYSDLKEAQKDPTFLEVLSEDLDDKSKGILFQLFIKSSNLARRTQRLFELNVEEQIKLAEDLKEFNEFMENKIKELESQKGVKNE